MTDSYPTRHKFFACRVIRLLGKTCAAQEIGATGAFLVTWVAMTEDAAGYSRAVTFYDGQLLPILGLESQKALANARSKAVDAGWLHYVAGCKGRAGRYWSKIPPHAASHDDNPSDEGHDARLIPRKKDGESAEKREGNRGRSDGESGGESGTIGQGNGQPFFPIPIPSNTPLTPQRGNRKKTPIEEFNADYRRREHFKPIGNDRSERAIKEWIASHHQELIPRDPATVRKMVAMAPQHPDELDFYRFAKRIAEGELS